MLSLVLLAGLALFAATPALAAKGDAWIGLQFGGSEPIGDFGRRAKAGFEGGLVGTVMVSEHVGAGLDVAYHAWDATDATVAPLVALFGPRWTARMSAIQSTVHVRYGLLTRSRASPYAQLGGGLYWTGTTLHGPFGSSTGYRTPHRGYNVGAGIESNLSPMFHVRVGGTYHSIESGEGGVPSADFFTVDASLMWGKGAK
jgi:opacity protein-like surface antigen